MAVIPKLKLLLLPIILIALIFVLKPLFNKSSGSLLPITSEAGAIYWAKKAPEVQEIMRKISDSPKGYGKSEQDTAVLSEQISGTFYGYKIEESSKHWYVTLIFCNAEWDENRCGCQGDFASIITRISQESGKVLISKDNPPRKVVNLKEGTTSFCD